MIGCADMLFTQNNTELFGIQLEDITGLLLLFASMPIGVLGNGLPFYAYEFWLSLLLTTLNILIQTVIIYVIYNFFKRD